MNNDLKKAATILVLISMLFPVVTHAQVTQDTYQQQLQQIISLLLQQIALLQKQLDLMQTVTQNTTSSVVATSTATQITISTSTSQLSLSFSKKPEIADGQLVWQTSIPATADLFLATSMDSESELIQHFATTTNFSIWIGGNGYSSAIYPYFTVSATTNGQGIRFSVKNPGYTAPSRWGCSKDGDCGG